MTKIGRFGFYRFSPHLGGLEATYGDDLRIGKRLRDFRLV